MLITEAIIRTLASAESFQRGEEYYQSGAVLNLVQRGQTLSAEVEGSHYEPYGVTIELEDGNLIDAECTCPYDWGGYCKHIVAVLLAYVRRSDQVEQRPPVTELLAGLERDTLVELLTKLLSEQPQLIDWVERQLVLKAAPVEASSPAEPRQRQTPVDPAPFRKQVHYLMRGAGYQDYGASWGIAQQMSELLNQVQPFLDAGDGHNALRILEAVTEPYIDHWYEFDDSDGELGGVFAELGRFWAEAILSADLSSGERQQWAEKLTAWQGEIDDYGIDDGFDVAIAAAEQGWDDAPLQKAMQGHISHKGAWEDEAPWYADDLAEIRLDILERQGRTTEYLHLAEAEGQTARYLTMLVKLGRIEEAVEYARQYLATTEDALALAQALREHRQPSEALQIAELGLTLQGETLALAQWLRDFATQMFQPDLALRAARIAFERSPSLAEYQAAELAAGANWPSVKAELLAKLAGTAYAFGKIDIYLHEGMIEEAIQTIDNSYYDYRTLERVVEAARQSHPDWVIRQTQKQAEQIMDAGKSQHYYHAIRWLENARQAYQAAGRAQEWRTYLEDLISKHSRKYSLRPQLEAMRK